MAKKQFVNISNAELAAKGVVALADKPNVAASYGVGGLSPTQLKLWFDKLGRLMADKINTIQTALSEEGQEYIGVDNLGASIASLGDLTASFLNGSFATILLAYHQASDVGDTTKLASLQAIINEKARLIAELTEAFNNYKTLIKSNAGAAEVGVADAYNGSGNKLSNVIADIANGTLAAKITFQMYGLETSNKSTATAKTLKECADLIADALQGDVGSGLLEKINDRYTKTQTDNLLSGKVDKTTYASDKNTSDGRLTALEGRATSIEGNIGNMSNVTPIAQNIALAIKSLNEDIDSLQLGVKPRIIRGVVLWATPETLDSSLIAALNAKVTEATGRQNPDNTDSVQVWDNQMPDAGKIYTYHYWSSEVIGSELDGWYLASIYMSPAITDIPSYVLNVLPTSWSENADEDGLYYISVPAITHGMGSDMSLYVDLRRKTEEGNFAPCNQFVVSATGTVICYTDEKFEGKLIVRVGKAYYTTNTTNIVTVEMEQVNGLAAALAAKVAASGGEAGDTIVTFTDVTGTAENISSGSTLKSIMGKIKNWFSRLGSLAFKSKIANTDVDSSAAIEYSKLSGVAASSHTHDDRYYTESEMDTKLGNKQNTLTFDDAPTASSSNPVKSGGVKTALDAKVTSSGGDIKDTVVTFSDATGTRSNISSGDSVKNIFAKIKQWFAALGALAFKGSVSNSDVASNAAIEYSKLSGVAASSHTHGNITSDGKVGTTADKLLATGTGGAVNAKTVAELKSLFLDITHPVGSIYMSATLDTAAKVATALGGTWQAWGAGRVPVGVDTNDTSFDTVEETGGEKTHTLITGEMPSHKHLYHVAERGYGGIIGFTTEQGAAINTYAAGTDLKGMYPQFGASEMEGGLGQLHIDSEGGGNAHNNLQPYITCYMYKRTA